MAESYLKDKKRVLPGAAHVGWTVRHQGPLCRRAAVIGAGGVERIVRTHADGGEKAALAKSADSVRTLMSLQGTRFQAEHNLSAGRAKYACFSPLPCWRFFRLPLHAGPR